VVDDIEISGKSYLSSKDKQLAANDKAEASEWRRMTGAGGSAYVL
jgi:hypothetical protein